MTRRLPIIPTLIVLVAIGAMVALGVWQLQRSAWKNNLIAHYQSAASAQPVPFPSGADYESDLYRRSSLECLEVQDRTAIAGRNHAGETGFAQVVTCDIGAGAPVAIRLGWTRDPELRNWDGGTISGWVIQGQGRAALVADTAPAGMEDLVQPDPNNMPNNHLSYAVQWFLFALSAAVIYVLALRRRNRGGADGAIIDG
ncbi:MAG: SURF1 family protein [Sphingomonadaceae bacterium]